MQNEKRRPTAGLMGDGNSGKSTLFSAIAGSVASPSGPLRLTPTPIELVVCELRAGRVFSIVDRLGNKDEVPIDTLLPTMERLDADAEQLVLYSKPSPLLERIRLIDLPGMRMTHDHDDVVRRFLEGPESCDVLLHVVSEIDAVNGVFEVPDDAVLPREQVIFFNKIDRINWADDASYPERVAEETEDRVRERLLKTMGRTDLLPEVVACSSLVALAAEVFCDEIFQNVLRLAEPGDMAILSSKNFFHSEVDALPSVKDRSAILDAANKSLQGPWIAPDFHKPAFPVLRFAIGLCIKQGITSTDELRYAMRRFSGIDRVRSVVLKVATSPRIEMRRRMLGEVKRTESEMLALRQSLSTTRALAARAKRMEAKIAGNGLGQTEDRTFYNGLKAYLADQELQLSARLTTASQWVSGVRESYLRESENSSEQVSADYRSQQIHKRREDKCV